MLARSSVVLRDSLLREALVRPPQPSPRRGPALRFAREASTGAVRSGAGSPPVARSAVARRATASVIACALAACTSSEGLRPADVGGAGSAGGGASDASRSGQAG